MFQTTHQVFLSSGGITLLVFKMTDKEDGIKPWLNSIQCRAPGSKIFIVGTFLDELR